MKILYNHWNYLSDKIGISSPDGGFSYLWSIFQELMNRGHEVYCVVDRDKEIVEKYGYSAFDAFSKMKRYKVYKNIKWVDLNNLPKIDLLVLEWRFPTKDNSKLFSEEGYLPDLEIQNTLITMYKDKCKIVVFDLDYKFTQQDEEKIKPWKVLETALKPKNSHISVFIPFDFEDILQFDTERINKDKQLVYIGNNYDRDSDLNTKIIPFSNSNVKKVWFVGNWLGDKNKEFRDKNFNIKYFDRIGARDFRFFLKDAVAVPLIAKEEYKERGYMTMRILETLLFGSLPISFSDFYGIDKFLPKQLIVDVNDYEKSMKKVMIYLTNMFYLDRIMLRKRITENLKFMDARNFVDKMLEGIENGTK